jgi:hypothetical protein
MKNASFQLRSPVGGTVELPTLREACAADIEKQISICEEGFTLQELPSPRSCVSPSAGEYASKEYRGDGRARQLRHSDPSTTTNSYGHILGDDHKLAIQAIESVFLSQEVGISKK